MITNSGCGYTVAPKITFETPKGYTGSGLLATTGIISTTGSVKLVTITNGGSGYIGSPSVGISTPKHVRQPVTAYSAVPSGAGLVSVTSAPISVGSSGYLFPHGTTGGVFYKMFLTVTFSVQLELEMEARALLLTTSVYMEER